jgi:hypothetical protein
MTGLKIQFDDVGKKYFARKHSENFLRVNNMDATGRTEEFLMTN